MSRQPERNIPHIRDVFGFHSNGGGWSRHHQDEERLAAQLKELHVSKPAGHDSAVSVGSSDDESAERRARPADSNKTASKKKKKWKEERTSRRDNSRTLTERDVKHLERHLSMKKTIRKKIMRDLQQAFVENPDEFRVDPHRTSPEQMKGINIQSLSFQQPKSHNPEPNFLDMLRADNADATDVRYYNDDDDSGHGSPTRESSVGRHANYETGFEDADDIYQPEAKKSSFWRRFTMKGRNKR